MKKKFLMFALKEILSLELTDVKRIYGLWYWGHHGVKANSEEEYGAWVSI